MDQSMKSPVLEVSHLTKHLSGRKILDDLSFTVHEGEIFGFLGPNGSGKTTTIKLMLGLLRMELGAISICHHDIVSGYEKAFGEVGGIIENPELYPYLSGYENLNLYRRMYDDIPKRRIDEVVALVGLQARIRDKVSKYSLGMRQRLGVAQALLCRPRLLVLDEPTNGLDPEGIRDLRDLMKKLSREEGVAVFVSSHLLSEIEQMCDRVAVLDRGRILGVYTMEEIHGAVGTTDGRHRYLFRTAESERLATLLAEQGYAPERVEGGVVLTLDEEETQTVLTLAVQNGVPLLGFEEQKRSLEDAFLELTGASRAFGGGARAVGLGMNDRDPNAMSLNGERTASADTVSPSADGEIYIPPSERKTDGADDTDGTRGGGGL